MQRQKRLYFSLIFVMTIAIICNVFFCCNFVVRAEGEKEPDVPETPVITPWDGVTFEDFNVAGNGTGTRLDPYIIDTAGKFAKLMYSVNTENCEHFGVYFKQTAHINMGATYDFETKEIGGIKWDSIGYYVSPTQYKVFSGNYDGGGYNISNVGFSDDSVYHRSYGLFGYTNNATISNVNVSINIKVNSVNYGVGGLIGRANNTKITNCNANVNILGNSSNIGGLVGVYATDNHLSLENNTTYGNIIINSINATNIAGVVALMDNMAAGGTISVSNCESRVYINVPQSIGGISGICSLTTGLVEIVNCNNYGYIETNNSVGGIIAMSAIEVRNCNNYGTITSTGSEVGGIVGFNMDKIVNCVNYATITGKDKVGGIAGITKSVVVDCINKGSVVGKNYVAGIVGEVQASGEEYIFEKNFNSANVTGENYVAGLVAKLSGVNMQLCFSVGVTTNTAENPFDIIGNNYVAGLVALVDNANIYNCISTSNISSGNIGAGLVAKYNGPAAKNTLENFYYIGSVKGIKIAGIIQDAGYVNLKDGYSVVNLVKIDENTDIDILNSGAVVGFSAESTYNTVLFNSDTCSVASGTVVTGLIAQTTDELIYDKNDLLNISDFYLLPEEPVERDYYYDYYPILRDLHFNIYNSNYDNYFINYSEVSSVIKRISIARTFDTVHITFVTNCDVEAEEVMCRQNVDITDLMPGVSKEGYVFRGWYLDPDFAVKANLEQGLTTSTTLYAKFEYPDLAFPWWIFIIIICVAIAALVGVLLFVFRKKTISFRVKDVDIPDIKIRVGTFIKLPAPKKPGHRFKGWYYNEELTKKFDLEIMPNINLILFGEFKEIKRKAKVETDINKVAKKSKSSTKKKVGVLKETTTNDNTEIIENNAKIVADDLSADTTKNEDKKEQ